MRLRSPVSMTSCSVRYGGMHQVKGLRICLVRYRPTNLQLEIRFKDYFFKKDFKEEKHEEALSQWN